MGSLAVGVAPVAPFFRIRPENAGALVVLVLAGATFVAMVVGLFLECVMAPG